MNQWSAVINEVPMGRDRIFKRYYRLVGLNQMLVENDDNGTELLFDPKRHEREDVDFESDEEMVMKVFICYVFDNNRIHFFILILKLKVEILSFTYICAYNKYY